ncbi:hypothetical protein [Leptospira sp. GIMC2001]|uniref:hypothetical protein n=1 Tax=Leptospira sp. GIMC2001 TaxID=1513297 RepID=UPI00234BFCE2|nr:hypothetical protein [Leptospira sp. GIMC2001]WCL49341.1 hypothetical protein O4O04_18935 [Leptospira sp. GIMC2001]
MLIVIRMVQILLIIVILSCSSNQSMKESVTEVVIYKVGKEYCANYFLWIAILVQAFSV